MRERVPPWSGSPGLIPAIHYKLIARQIGQRSPRERLVRYTQSRPPQPPLFLPPHPLAMSFFRNTQWVFLHNLALPNCLAKIVT